MINERSLGQRAVLCRLLDCVAYADEQLVDLQSRRLQVLQQMVGEDAMWIFWELNRSRSWRACKGHERSFGVHRGESVEGSSTGTERARAGWERVVTAAVEHERVESRPPSLHLGEQVVRIERIPRQIRIALRYISSEQPVGGAGLASLQDRGLCAVACEIEERNVVFLQGVDKRAPGFEKGIDVTVCY